MSKQSADITISGKHGPILKVKWEGKDVECEHGTGEFLNFGNISKGKAGQRVEYLLIARTLPQSEDA